MLLRTVGCSARATATSKFAFTSTASGTQPMDVTRIADSTAYLLGAETISSADLVLSERLGQVVRQSGPALGLVILHGGYHAD